MDESRFLAHRVRPFALGRSIHRIAIISAVGLLLASPTPSGSTEPRAVQGATVAGSYLRTDDAALGDGVRIRERQSGLQA